MFDFYGSNQTYAKSSINFKKIKNIQYICGHFLRGIKGTVF